MEKSVVTSLDGRGESVKTQISNEMVRIYKDQLGRGPVKTRTDFAGTDVVICSLEKSLTPAEQRLAEMGEHQRLRDTRMFFQYATKSEFVKSVEELTGRKVRGFVSGIDTETDISSEVFYLEPATEASQDRQSL